MFAVNIGKELSLVSDHSKCSVNASCYYSLSDRVTAPWGWNHVWWFVCRYVSVCGLVWEYPVLCTFLSNLLWQCQIGSGEKFAVSCFFWKVSGPACPRSSVPGPWRSKNWSRPDADTHTLQPSKQYAFPSACMSSLSPAGLCSAFLKLKGSPCTS